MAAAHIYDAEEVCGQQVNMGQEESMRVQYGIRGAFDGLRVKQQSYTLTQLDTRTTAHKCVACASGQHSACALSKGAGCILT